jgi:hypothetical protein
LVAATSRTSTWMVVELPSLSNSLSCRTRSNLGCSSSRGVRLDSRCASGDSEARLPTSRHRVVRFRGGSHRDGRTMARGDAQISLRYRPATRGSHASCNNS